MDASCARDSNLGEKVFRGPRGSLETRLKSCGVNRSQAGVEFGLVQPRAAAVDRRRSNKVLDLSFTLWFSVGPFHYCNHDQTRPNTSRPMASTRVSVARTVETPEAWGPLRACKAGTRSGTQSGAPFVIVRTDGDP